jgi:RNA polymerase sigma-B factor
VHCHGSDVPSTHTWPLPVPDLTEQEPKDDPTAGPLPARNGHGDSEPGPAQPAPSDTARHGATQEDRAARAAEDRRLLERYHRSGDRSAREEVVQRFLPLARQLARRYAGAGEPLEDLVQVASLGLVKAVDRFDPGRAVAFSSFAVPTILGELKRHFRDKGWSVRVPRDLQELALRLDRTSEELGRELGRAPTTAEVAERLGVSEEEILEAREAAHAYRAVSLDRPRTDDDESGPAVADAMGGEDPGFRRAEDAATVDQLLRVLAPREREVLRLRFVEDLTQQEIGDRIGVSQMHVSRLIRQAIARLGEAAEE